jgi:hypothetical protein
MDDTTDPFDGIGSSTATETAPREARPDSGGDGLRHIICVECYPAFDGALEAPQDAVCICGHRIREGDPRPPGDAPQCILCNELRTHHNATVHG